MKYKNNIFCVSNPTRIIDALLGLCDVPLDECIIFLPSRRAIRSVEKAIVKKFGASILPRLVRLGEGGEEEITEHREQSTEIERVLLCAKLLARDRDIKNLSTALPIAHDLIRMQNYLENEGIDYRGINWNEIVSEKYAEHFQKKAKIFQILNNVMRDGLMTVAQKHRLEV